MAVSGQGQVGGCSSHSRSPPQKRAKAREERGRPPPRGWGPQEGSHSCQQAPSWSRGGGLHTDVSGLGTLCASLTSPWHCALGLGSRNPAIKAGWHRPPGPCSYVPAHSLIQPCPSAPTCSFSPPSLCGSLLQTPSALSPTSPEGGPRPSQGLGLLASETLVTPLQSRPPEGPCRGRRWLCQRRW